MRTSYCKQKNVVTIKLERQEFEDLKYETERDDTDMVWSIIESCDNVIETPERFNIDHLSDLLDEEEEEELMVDEPPIRIDISEESNQWRTGTESIGEFRQNFAD